jgi:acetolactate synthase regulatory subunit
MLTLLFLSESESGYAVHSIDFQHREPSKNQHLEIITQTSMAINVLRQQH